MHPFFKLIDEYPDFPKKGILFRDISPLLQHAYHPVLYTLRELLSEAEWQEVTMIVGIEARGFILAAGLAAVVNKGFLPIRKLGKLPGITQKQSYHLEYGEACLEMHPGKGKIVIVDDVLATGGTLQAAQLLAVKSGYQVNAGLILLNLKSLNTQKQELEIRSVLEIE